MKDTQVIDSATGKETHETVEYVYNWYVVRKKRARHKKIIKVGGWGYTVEEASKRLQDKIKEIKSDYSEWTCHKDFESHCKARLVTYSDGMQIVMV